jgi:myo-inositol-1(or 4)-monophosphatase
MIGASALDLVLVADGTFDVAITLGNRPWDTSAGAVIAREAGAVVMDTDGSTHTTASKATIATTPGLRDDILALLAESAAGSRYAPAPDTQRESAGPTQCAELRDQAQRIDGDPSGER